MRHFSIYAPTSGALHYYTVTLIGFRHGMVVRWERRTDSWHPSVIRLRDIPTFDGSCLEGYRLLDPSHVDPLALEAMTGQA